MSYINLIQKTAYIFVILIVGCSEINNKVTVKVYHNEEWNVWSSKRYGLPGVLDKRISSDCEEHIVTKNKNYVTILRNNGGGGEDKVMKLQEVKTNEIIKETSLIHVADVYVNKEDTEQLTLENVWELLGKSNSWENTNVKLLNVKPGCARPRSLIGGDILELPNGEKYIIDEVGFTKIQPVIPAKNIPLQKFK